MNRFSRMISLVCLLLSFGTAMNAAAAEGMIKSKDMRQWCMGRLLVSLPEAFHPVDVIGNIRGVEIHFLPGRSRQQALAERVAELRAGRAEPDGVPLRLRGQVNQQGQTILSYEPDFSALGLVSGDDWYEEIFTPTEGGVFRLVQYVSTGQQAERRGELLSVAQAIKPLSERLPDEQGACFGQAFVALPPGDEVVTMIFVASGGDAGAYQIAYLHRTAGTAGGYPFDFEALSATGTRPVTVAGLPGVEETPPDAPLEFALVAGRPGSARQDGIKITAGFTAGRSHSLPFEQSQAVWHALLSSMTLGR